MKNKYRGLLSFLLTNVLAAGACQGFFGASPSTPGGAVPTSAPGGDIKQTVQGLFSSGTQASGSGAPSAADAMASFPLAPDSKMVSNSADSAKPGETKGNFTIQSTAVVGTVVQFYKDELPKQGWVLRYSDPNRQGGATLYWKKNFIFLTLDFRYENAVLVAHGNYNFVDPQSLQERIKDFPLPDHTELTSSSNTAWKFYVQQDYSTVAGFYTSQADSRHWTSCIHPGSGSQGEGDDGGGSRIKFPNGVTPMPSPTTDTRASKELQCNLPDGNEVDIQVYPHGNAAILNVSLIIKNLSSSGLPKDIPLYPGATVQIMDIGSASYTIGADAATVKVYYLEHMPAAGWVPDGDPMESGGMFVQDWKKDSQRITLSIIPNGSGSMLMIDCPTCKS
jgi:hypothetical protein